MKNKMLYGYLYGLFPGNVDRNIIEPYKTMSLLKLDCFERFYFMIGFNAGCFERNLKIMTGKWHLLGGVWGSIPEGTTAEYWKGSEKIVRKRCGD